MRKDDLRSEIRDYYAKVGNWRRVGQRLGMSKATAWKLINDPSYPVTDQMIYHWQGWTPDLPYRPRLPKEAKPLIDQYRDLEIDIVAGLEIGLQSLIGDCSDDHTDNGEG